MQRNVTVEAMVQSKYQDQIDASSAVVDKLQLQLQTRTKRLLELSRRLATSQQALLRAKTDLFG